MDSKKLHSLLGDLHRFLGTYSAEEMLSASEQSQDCRPILLSIVDALTTPVVGRREVDAISAARAAEPNAGSLTQSPPSDVEEIENLLRRSGRADSKAELDAMVRVYALGISLSSKDGRDRSIAKVARAIQKAPYRIKARIFREIAKAPTGETQGWLDVIRRR